MSLNSTPTAAGSDSIKTPLGSHLRNESGWHYTADFDNAEIYQDALDHRPDGPAYFCHKGRTCPIEVGDDPLRLATRWDDTRRTPEVPEAALPN
jgi:hypothetical protein